MLFNSSEILAEKHDDIGISDNTTVNFIIDCNHLSETIPYVKSGYDYHFVSFGNWSNIALLEYLLKFTGKAKLFATSWSISDYSVKRLIALLELNLIEDAKFIFDKRTGIFNPNIFHFAKSNLNVQLTSIHAKTMVLIGEKMSLCVVQSANLNENRRIESGVVSTHKNTVSFHKDWILKLFNDLKDAAK